MIPGLSRIVGDCEAIPTGFGIAYRLPERHAVVCYPVGLNLLVRFCLEAYYISRIPATSWWEDRAAQHFSNGYRQGVEDTRRQYAGRPPKGGIFIPLDKIRQG